MKQFVLFVILSFSLSCFATDRGLIDANLTKEIKDTFMIDGTFSIKKINKYRDYIKERRAEILSTLIDYKVKYQFKETQNSTDKAEQEKEIQLFNYILKELDLVYFKKRVEAMEMCLRILEIDYALKVTGNEAPIVRGYQAIKNLFKSHLIKKYELREGEAGNLISPNTGLPYNQDELIMLKNQGEDISELNPSSNSTFWKNIDIRNTDVKRRFHGESKLYKNLLTDLPFKLGEFKKIKKTNTKPKIDFISEVNGRKRKFKMKLGSEVHSEITASALASTLGFHVDISQYVKDFKLELPKEISLKDLKKEWNSYFSEYDFENHVKHFGKDDKGISYVTFKEALIETRPEGLTRVGPWAWGKHGHRSLRETRGLFLFNIWIANNGLKEAANNKLVMKDGNKKIKEFFHYQHNLGFSFGRFFKEKPKDFPWDVIKEKNNDAVELFFYSFETNSGFEHVSYSDAKWMTRLIAKLSREQIVDAVELGGWPREVGMLLVEKLISRRNQLVYAFDLEEEFEPIEFDRFITTDNKILLNGELTKDIFIESTQNYQNEIEDVLEPVYDGIESIAVKAALMATSHFDTIVLDGDSFGYDGSLIGEVEVSADRQIVNNPDQKGLTDNYLVEDTVKVRIGLGVGLVARGKINYIKEYKIVYPVETIEEGRYKNGFIFNAMLPKHVRTVELPDEYVLILEDTLEGQGELILGRENFPFTISMAKSLGKLTRTVISKKLDSFEVYRDLSPFKAFHKKLFAELIFFKIPVWHSSAYEGILSRSVYKLNIKDKDDLSLVALDTLLQTGDMRPIVEYGQKRELISNYVSKRSDSKFLGLFETKEKRRTDDVEEIIYDKSGDLKTKTFFQIDIDRSDEWDLLGDGELKRQKMRLLGQVDHEGNLKTPYLDLRFTVNDQITTTSELSNIYFKLIDDLSLTKKFINFTPSLHTTNNLWGNTFVQVRLGYGKKTLDKIINTTDEKYYELMAMFASKPYQTSNWWKRRTNKNLSVSNKEYKRKLRVFLSLLKKARRASSEKIKYMHVVDAIDQMLWIGSGSFNVNFLKRIHYLIGKKSYFMDALVTMPESKEMIYSAAAPLFNNMNTPLRKDIDIYEFDFDKPEEVWNVFY